jgi:ACS family tartrate transporter-like MFS transporter
MAAPSASVSTAKDSAIVRKVRLGILPFLFLLYVVAYMDRINIGFAALTMNRDLGITSQQFGFLAGIFFIGYFIFEIPSNLIMHRVGARLWISRILISWGVVASFTAVAATAHQLYLFRFLLGVAEAGFFPGVILYLTYWFQRQEQAQAVALFMIAVPISGVIGAPLSGLILDHVHWFGLSSWRWLLALEGAPAIVCGILAYRLLANGPREAKFLTAEEKDRSLEILAADQGQRHAVAEHSPFRALGKGRVWHLVAIYFTEVVASYALSIWLPQIVKSFSRGYSDTLIGVLVMAPMLAGLIGMVLISRSSDRKFERRWHVAIPLLAGGVAILFVPLVRSVWAALILLSAGVVGVYGCLGPFWALPAEFLAGYGAAAGIALINSIGNLGGFVGPYVLGVVMGRTGKVAGGLLFAGACMILSAALMILFPRPSAGARTDAPLRPSGELGR